MQLPQILFKAIDRFLLMRRRFVAQFSVVPRITELLDQPEGREQFWLAENNFGKGLLVKVIDIPRAKPNQIDQENRDGDDGDHHDSKNPLQHALAQRVRMLLVNQNFAAMSQSGAL